MTDTALDKYRYTLYEELADVFHVITPDHCFHDTGKQYTCKLQKTEFVFRFSQADDNTPQIFGSFDRLDSRFKLIAITTSQSYSNFPCPLGIRLYNKDEKLKIATGVYYENNCYHNILFPGPSAEKKLLHQSITSSSIDIVEIMDQLKTQKGDIWKGSIEVNQEDDEGNPFLFLPFNGCIISQLFTILDKKKKKGFYNKAAGYYILPHEKETMHDYLKTFETENEVDFTWRELKIQPIILSSPPHDDKYALVQVQVYYYENK